MRPWQSRGGPERRTAGAGGGWGFLVPGAALLAAIILTGPAPARASDETESEAVLSAQIEVENELLVKDRSRYRDAARERNALEERLASLTNELDTLALGQGKDPTPERIEALRKEVAFAEQARSESIERCREALDQIRQRLERIVLLEGKLEEFKRRAHPEDEPLSGVWDIVYSPSGDRGVFTLSQSGTLVSGRYTFQGGWKGSLQGTFIGGKVYLQRIDSKLGRSSELEGYLDSGGGRIRGTWQNYNLTDGAAASGTWIAVLRTE